MSHQPFRQKSERFYCYLGRMVIGVASCLGYLPREVGMGKLMRALVFLIKEITPHQLFFVCKVIINVIDQFAKDNEQRFNE